MHDEGGLQALAARQHGLVSFEQARACGILSHEIRRLTDGGHWDLCGPRVLRICGAPPSRGHRLMVAVLDQGGDAVISHKCSAWWWRVPGFSARLVQITTTMATRRAPAGAEVHKVRELPPRWVTVLDGVPVVRPELMILQLCASVHPLRAERALDNAWREGLLSGSSIDALLDDLGRRGRDGVALLRELRAARDGDYVPPGSNLERRAIDVLAPLGLELIRQVNLGGEAWSGRVDFLDAHRPLVIEVQSEKYHSALLDRVADGLRRQKLKCDGFVVVEITDVELWTMPDVARARVAEQMRRVRHRA